MSPTARTLAKLRKDVWTAAVVEKWIPQVKRRRDCFGFDVLACKPTRMSKVIIGMYREVLDEPGILGVQATSAANHSSRKAKLLKNAEAANWVAAGGRLEVWSWKKGNARKARHLWTCRIEALRLSDFIPEAA